MRFIDTHAHLYSSPIKENIEGIMKNAMDNGIDTIIMPAIDSTTLEAMLEVEKTYPENCMAMMGLHPCSVKENVKEELAIIEAQLQKRKFIAIGEIGLDYYWDKTFTTEQMHAFEIQMQWALDYKLPIAIHTRNAMGETIEAEKQ
jgi:TatD DNase family protein